MVDSNDTVKPDYGRTKRYKELAPRANEKFKFDANAEGNKLRGQMWCNFHGANGSHESDKCRIILNEQHMRDGKPLDKMPHPEALQTMPTKAQQMAGQKRKLEADIHSLLDLKDMIGRRHGIKRGRKTRR